MFKIDFKGKIRSLKDKLHNLVELLKRYRLPLFMAVTLFIILTTFDCVYPGTYHDTDSVRYILSAISQGLAAILALVFTITLVLAQMTGRYTAMEKIIFRLETQVLMIIFGVGVVVPLLVLKIGFWQHGVNLSIAITIFCVFSLIPFVKSLNGVLKYDIRILDISEDVYEEIENRRTERVKNIITELNKIGKGAVRDHREDVLPDILDLLSEIGKKTASIGYANTTSLVIEGLKEIGIECIENGFWYDKKLIPREIPEIAILGLNDIGVLVAEYDQKNSQNKFRGIISSVVDVLKNIGVESSKNQLNRTTIKAFSSLKNIIIALKDNKELSAKRNRIIAVGEVWGLGVFITKYMDGRIDFVIQNLKEIEEVVGVETMMNRRDNCVNDYPDLKSSLEEFKKRYDDYNAQSI